MTLAIRLSCALGLATLLAGHSAHAQQLDSLPVGARIRLVSPDPERPALDRRITAILASVTADTLGIRFAANGERFGIARPAIRRLEVSTEHRSAWQGALMGAAYGVLVGAATTVLILGSSHCNDDCWLSGTAEALITFVPITLITSSVGAIVFSRRQDTWRDVPLPPR